MKNSRLTSAVSAAALSLVLLVSGCATGSGEPAPVTSSPAASPTPTPTESPVPTETASPSTAPQPVVSGNLLLDGRTGEVWTPQGMNWPSFEYACAQGWDYSQEGADADTAAALVDWNVDLVRLTLNQDCWLGTNKAPGGDLTEDGYHEAVKSFVADLNDAGIAVVLSLHSVAADTDDQFGLIAMPNEDSVSFWSSIADTFVDNPSVIFDAFNEPYSVWSSAESKWVFELDWNCWANGGCTPPIETDSEKPPLSGKTYTAVGMNDVVEAIRLTGATQPIMLSGLDYANDLREWLQYAPDDDQLVAGYHSYPDLRCSEEKCWDDEIATLAQSVPVLFAEFGESDGGTGYVESVMDWASARGIGYIAWAWYVHQDNPFTLISEQDGTPKKGTGRAVYDFYNRNLSSRDAD